MSDLKIVKLGEIAHINMGQSPESIYYNTNELGLPLIQGNADIKERKSIQRIWTISPTKICDEGDILMTVRAPVGSIGISTLKSCLGRGVCGMKALSIDERYLYHLLVSIEDSWKQFEQGSTFTAVGSKEILNFQLSVLKSNTDQQNVAKILDICDTVITETQLAIAKYKAIKQGMLHDLFTSGLDANGKLRPSFQKAPELYKSSELGMIPKEWEVKRLEKLTEKIGSGVTPTGGSEVYQTSGVLFIRSQNVLIGCLSIDNVAFITSEIDEKMEGSRVRPYDVLLNITGASIGRCAYFPKELKSANVNQHVCIIRFKDISKSLAVYASEFLNSNFGQSQIYKSNAGGNREGLNFQQIKGFNFPSIPPSELERIAKIIELQSNKLKSEEVLLQKYQSIRRGLMGDLLSGKKIITKK